MAHKTLGYTPGAGAGVAVDEVGAVEFQRVKITLGNEGIDGGDLSGDNPLPVIVLETVLPAGAASDAGLAAILGALGAGINVTVDGTPLPPGASTEATLALIKAKTDNLDAATSTLAKASAQTDGTQKAIARGGAKGTTVAADITSTASGANHQGADVVLYDAAGNVIDPRVIRAIASGTDSIAAVQGTAAAAAGAWPVKVTDGTNVAAVKAASTSAATTDPSAVVQLSPNQPQLTTPLNLQGAKTHNNAAPGTTNVGTLPAIANAAAPSVTEGNQAGLSIDLTGSMRTIIRPQAVLGSYMLNGNISYTATTVNGIIFSFRWGDATRKCRLVRVSVAVICVAFTTAGLVERQFILVRSFTASDTGGTSLLPTSSNNKKQTAQGTSLLTAASVGGFLTAGTGTADANPMSSVPAWMSAVGNVIGGGQLVPLYDVETARQPVVFAQNEGFRIRLGAAETASTRQTFVNVEWDEGNSF